MSIQSQLFFPLNQLWKFDLCAQSGLENWLLHSFSLEVSLPARLIVYNFNTDCFFHDTTIQLSWLMGDCQMCYLSTHCGRRAAGIRIFHDEQEVFQQSNCLGLFSQHLNLSYRWHCLAPRRTCILQRLLTFLANPSPANSDPYGKNVNDILIFWHWRSEEID